MDDSLVSLTRRELGETPTRVRRIEEGLLHETYELQCDSGEYVLQFASDSTADRRDDLARGLYWYLLLADTEVPVPEAVTETVREFARRTYSLVEKLPGTTGGRDISPGRVRSAGRSLAKIHDARQFDEAGWLRFDGRTPTVQPFDEGSLGRWIQQTVQRRAGLLREAGLDTAASAIQRLFDRRGGELPTDFQPVLCHGDYSPDNVLFDGATVTGVLDFDRSYAGHDQRDVVHSANAFWMHDPCVDWDVRAAFYDGYRTERELDGSFRDTETLYRVETLLQPVAGMYELDELSAYEAAFYGERLLEAVERAMRR